ncbi:Hypothetical protein ADU72_2354 (plasmid) [Pediococcus damnosus]|uniref:Uncharacterized protein n=1 Tax=Pediococcus damnosus TaxID=51663 RepID=A0ABN4NHI3_9LACO|nr:Hypothetical protein ADU72_2354 [Pediococcus damnosus]
MSIKTNAPTSCRIEVAVLGTELANSSLTCVESLTNLDVISPDLVWSK